MSAALVISTHPLLLVSRPLTVTTSLEAMVSRPWWCLGPGKSFVIRSSLQMLSSSPLSLCSPSLLRLSKLRSVSPAPGERRPDLGLASSLWTWQGRLLNSPTSEWPGPSLSPGLKPKLCLNTIEWRLCIWAVMLKIRKCWLRLILFSFGAQYP